MTGERELTLGERRVGVDFNPSGDPAIADIKRRAAGLLDAVVALPAPDGEAARVRAVAMTEIEGAAMWAVKAAARAAG
ncbi:MAG: hypothetical protein OXC28_07150 [Defluviicoccus sp.]|nr:hypothetical protein [Defluviicoccus sp.]